MSKSVKRVLFGIGRQPGEGFSGTSWLSTAVVFTIATVVFALDSYWIVAVIFGIGAVASAKASITRFREGTII